MKRKKISVTSLILPVIMLVVAVVLPMIYSTNYYIQLFSQTLINLVAVLGLNVVMGLAGQTNLGTIALVALGSYTSALISQATGSTNLVGLLAALVVAVLVGFMLGYPSLRVSGIFLSLTTMSVAQIVYSLANSMQWLTGGAMGVKDISEPNIFGIEFKTQAQLLPILFWSLQSCSSSSPCVWRSPSTAARSRLSAITPRQSSPSA
ncbi:MAG: branched-chain amino acid ABC transporter permease [Oscillospiraceae bacterium]